jgi:hypothetical protein
MVTKNFKSDLEYIVNITNADIAAKKGDGRQKKIKKNLLKAAHRTYFRLLKPEIKGKSYQ